MMRNQSLWQSAASQRAKTLWSFLLKKAKSVEDCGYVQDETKWPVFVPFSQISFGIVLNKTQDDELYNEHPLGHFLAYSEGLEVILTVLHNHMSPIAVLLNLKLLALHEPAIGLYDGSRFFEMTHDEPLPWERYINRILREISLNCLGLCISPIVKETNMKSRNTNRNPLRNGRT